MAFDVGYTTPDGLVVPAATSTDDIPHVLQGLFDGSNGGGNLNHTRIQGDFASVAALTAAFASVPDAQKPALAKVTSLGLYQWVPSPYSVWIPALGKTELFNAPTRTAQTVTASSTQVGITEQLVIAVPPYPLLMWVHFRARVSQSGGATVGNTYLSFNSVGADAYQTISSFPGSTAVTVPVKIPGTAAGGASTYTVQGGLEYVSGATSSGISADGTDTPRTRLSAVISPFYANVGGSPF